MLCGMIGQFLKVAYALAASYAAGKWAVYYAGACRGYQAAGGEYLFILVTYCLAVKMAGMLFAAVEKRNASHSLYRGSCRKICGLCRKTCSSCRKGSKHIIFWYDKKTEADRHRKTENRKTGNLKTETEKPARQRQEYLKPSPAAGPRENSGTAQTSNMDNIIQWNDKVQDVRTRKRSKNAGSKSAQRKKRRI